MSEMPSIPSPDVSATVAIEVLPVEEEEDDFETLAFVQRVRVGLHRGLTQLNEYTVSAIPTNERNIDVIVLLTLIGASLVASKDLLTSFFNMVTAALELLAKNDHVQEIEVIIDGKPLILRDLTKKTAKELLEALQAQQPAMTKQLKTQESLKMTARVSQKRRGKH
jgi:hypothetical protein